MQAPARPPVDPAVRGFLDHLAEAVAEAVLRDLNPPIANEAPCTEHVRQKPGAAA